MKKRVLNISPEMQNLFCKHLGVANLRTAGYKEWFAKAYFLLLALVSIASPFYFQDFLKKVFDLGPVTITGSSIHLLVLLIVWGVSFSFMMKIMNESHRLEHSVRIICEELDFWKGDDFINKELVYRKLQKIASAQILAERGYDDARYNRQVSRDDLAMLDEQRIGTKSKFDRIANCCLTLGIEIDKPGIFKRAEELLGKAHIHRPDESS